MMNNNEELVKAFANGSSVVFDEDFVDETTLVSLKHYQGAAHELLERLKQETLLSERERLRGVVQEHLRKIDLLLERAGVQ